jgi:hypothetical protein
MGDPLVPSSDTGVSTGFVVGRVVLVLIYGVLAAASGVFLVRERRVVPMRFQHTPVLVGCFIKAIYFLMFAIASAGATFDCPQSFAYTLEVLPSFFVCSGFTALWYFWLEAEDGSTLQKTRRGLYILNSIFWGVAVVFLLADWSSNRYKANLLDPNHKNQIPELLLGLELACVYYGMAGGFFAIGRNVFQASRRVHVLAAQASVSDTPKIYEFHPTSAVLPSFAVC